MNRRALSILALCTTLFPAIALADSSKTIAAPGVTNVDLRILTDLTIQQGDQESLVLSGDEDTLAKVSATVANGNLVIDAASSTGGFWSRSPKVSGKLTIKHLEKLQIEGGGDIEVGAMKTTHLELNVAGSAKVQLKDLQADALDIVVSGHGDVTASGSATGVLVKISGLGDTDLTHLQSLAAKVVISGKGNVGLAVKDRLDARIAGMGDVHYKGNPSVTKSISGLGSVSAVN
jgi:hypothetical protein